MVRFDAAELHSFVKAKINKKQNKKTKLKFNNLIFRLLIFKKCYCKIPQYLGENLSSIVFYILRLCIFFKMSKKKVKNTYLI